MVNDTTLLLGLDGVSVMRVERLEDGTRRVHLATADEAARACPSCGVFASRVKGLGDDPAAGSPLRRARVGVLVAQAPLVVPGAGRARGSRSPRDRPDTGRGAADRPAAEAAGRRVRDAGSTVVQAARDLHLSWPTVMDAFRTSAREVVDAPLPEVRVLGIDETRRGRPRWEQDPDSGKWRLVRDRWHTGFVDALGTGGLLGQVEGRTVADVLAWLATTPLTWRKDIRPRRHRHVGHLPRGDPHRPAARHRRGRPLPRRPARQQDALHGAAPHHRRDPRADADAPPTRSGRPDDDSCATARTSPTSSSRPCGTPCWTRGRSGRRC